MSKNFSELSGRRGIEDNLFEELGRGAKTSGTVDASTLEELAEKFLVGDAHVLGAVSFYDFLRPENQGKKVYLCNGSACLAAGTQTALRDTLSGHFSPQEIGEMCCLGRCHENSAFHYQDQNYSGSAVSDLSEIIRKGKKVTDSYHVEALGTPVLTGGFPGWDIYSNLLTRALQIGPNALIEEMKASGLRGRGGAGFPTAFKLEACKNTPGDLKFIVCNADEGDPGAYSDRYLLEQRPESVLMGMVLAGLITGAQWGVVYVRGEYPEAFPILDETLRAMQHHQLIGDSVLGSSFSFRFKIIRAQGAYICGEETALLNSIEGQRPEVRVRPPFPTQSGLFNKPTVVNNVETLACIPYIIQHGGSAFASIGHATSTGTKLLSLDSFFNRPGIYEVPTGTPLSTVVNTLGQGFREPVKALHIGGPLGGLVPVSRIPDLTIDYDTFSANGFLLGHGSLLCIPESFPMMHYLEHLFEFTAHESCGKCFPCRLGSTRGKELLSKAIHSNYQINRALFEDLIETMQIGSLCALGGGLPLPIKNALHYFSDELSPHFS
jgi:NADH-quinone oxidoreductase subunit F